MVTLDKNVRMVMLQFSFSNPDVIPLSMRRKTQNEPLLFDCKTRLDGVLVIKPTEKCSLVKFIGELEMSGYKIVNAFYRKRIDNKDPSSKRKYHIVRFFFARREFAEISDEFKKNRNTVYAELRSMCENAMWQVKLFSNKFYKDDKEIHGQNALSINLGARQPLYYPDGQVVTVWKKDNDGKRIGEAPIPMKADYYLCADNNTIKLKTA